VCVGGAGGGRGGEKGGAGGGGWRISSLEYRYPAVQTPGLEQSMKQMIRKSIDQSMTIKALLVNWHRLIDDQSIITQKLSKLIGLF